MVNIVSRVWAHADSEPDRVAIRSPRTITFEQLRETNRRVAGAVRAAGLQPLDRVLFVAPTIPEFPEVYYGLHAAGVTVTTMNVMSTIPEIDYVLDDCDASLVIAWHECADAARTAAERRGVPFWQVDPGAGFDAEPLVQAHEHEADDTAIILYTSGTTGRPKGAELTASNLVDTVDSFLPVLELGDADRFGTALPLFHVFGQAVCMNTALAVGASFSLLSPFDPAKMLEMVRTDRLTTMSGVPTMWNAMLHAEGDFTPEDFASLRMATSGGASLPVEVIRAFTERFGCSILEGYGLTETTGAATFNDLNREQRTGTTGPALPGTRIEVRDSTGAVMPVGEVGEVFIKGPTVMKGYWNRPEATASELVDGWLKTGDLGSLDADGYLTIVDRVKDLVIRGGYNVYPREVEEVLYEHPAIVEVAVVGIPDEHYGEEIAAVIALAPGHEVTGEELRTWAKERLSAYKVPRVYSFVDTLPKGATGKIQKRAIDKDALLELARDAARAR
ncbi:long-chain-fatty-acid--CoA ligase [Aeromicrobium duanguangcaii]|uniref:Long-chain fatty acid--CoA ligase n=1 Tax=Aeromicrobium duanguangcaii TaxID=2968086 RepID=A0ABY5KEW6_9ACTN|nr:long-chain fatty acid--CoA ligase [Aeromicrobium duanguangcaii]MCD9153919.1 long-chain fatty acid--CoA ligase [Aeromicrobium duanguangcaii]UUI69002.1 long-chain fatty acid--CoA ligase [Aeromicrobium duanguangcaii]